MDKEECIQKPGAVIKPPIESTAQVISMAKNLYGLTVKEVTELNAYDDKNYHLIMSENDVKNPNISEIWPHGYVLKIMNSLDSKDVGFVDAQNQLMIYISSKGFPTPEPIKNIDGQYYSIESLEKEQERSTSYHVVRLLKYQPGILLKSVKCSSSSLLKLYYEVGLKAATLNSLMKEFHHEAYSKRSSIWHLQNALKIKQFLFALKDKERVKLVLRVLEEFEDSVVNNLNNLQKGLIHGDLNEMNILVDHCGTDVINAYRVTTIIDYGDSHISAYVLELATNIIYLVLQSGDLESGAFVVEGYHKINPLPMEEYKLLPICASARLCQSLVLGLYNSTLDPSNQYVLQTQETGWKLLNEITSAGEVKVNNIWMKKIISS